MNEIVHHSMPRHDISKESAVAVAFAKERAYYFWSCVYSVALHFQQRKSVANASPCAAIVSGSQTFRDFQLIVTLFLVAPFLSTHFPDVFVCVERPMAVLSRISQPSLFFLAFFCSREMKRIFHQFVQRTIFTTAIRAKIEAKNITHYS